MAGPPGAGKKMMEGVDNLELGEKQKEDMLRHLTTIANDTQELMMKGGGSGLGVGRSHPASTGATGVSSILREQEHGGQQQERHPVPPLPRYVLLARSTRRSILTAIEWPLYLVSLSVLSSLFSVRFFLILL